MSSSAANAPAGGNQSRLTKAALEAEVEELREQLAKLSRESEANTSLQGGIKRPKALNLDTIAVEKQSEVFADWTSSLLRYYTRLRVRKSTLSEKEFLLEVPDLIEGKLSRIVTKMERAGTFPPDTITELLDLIKATYRIKAQGEISTELFRSARQLKRTPREYLVYLEELQLDIEVDDTVPDKISSEILYFKFKTTLWREIQDELARLIAKDKLRVDGTVTGDISTVGKLLPVVEFIYDQLSSKKEKKDKDNATGSRQLSGSGGGRSGSQNSVKTGVQPGQTGTRAAGSPVPFKDLPEERRKSISTFQKQHTPPYTTEADKISATKLGLCLHCGKYGHRKATCYKMKSATSGTPSLAAAASSDSEKATATPLKQSGN